MKAIVRLIAVIAELMIPVLLGAKYGIGAGVACAFMFICFALDITLKEMIDKEEEENES